VNIYAYKGANQAISVGEGFFGICCHQFVYHGGIDDGETRMMTLVSHADFFLRRHLLRRHAAVPVRRPLNYQGI